MISMTSSEGHASVRVARDAITQDVPLHATAPGKLLMSSLPLAELNRMLSGITLATPTSGTVTQKSFLRDQIARIREDDYAEVVGELDPHLASVAAPVRNHSGIIVGAFSYLIPASRFLDQRRAYRNICTEAARKISSRLGWQEPGEDVQHLNGERRRRSKARPTGANTAERISHDRR
jgi:DNA-binding IclR family transcriptional regulator